MAFGFQGSGFAPGFQQQSEVVGVAIGTLSQITGAAEGIGGEIVVPEPTAPVRPIGGGSIKVKPSRKVTRARRKKLLPAETLPEPIPPVIGTAAGTLVGVSGKGRATHGVSGTGAGAISANISGAAVGAFFDSVAADNDLLLLAA